eukprot:jgi/Mesvir1/7679/Mv11649-RA.1
MVRVDDDDQERGIDPSAMSFRLTNQPKHKPALSSLTFGANFTDHMMTMDWNVRHGWHAPAVEPLSAITLHPASQVFHYGTECFEGMKAFRAVDGSTRLFRPDRNMARLRSSAERLLLPTFDEDALLECIKALVRVDRSWIPDAEGYSLYIRPTMIATTSSLGVAPASDAKLFVVMCPVGPYFPSGFKPIKLFLDDRNARAWAGGAGQYKIGGNYAPTLKPQREARSHGCSQVLYVQARDGGPGSGLLSECGAMNMFFFFHHPDGSRELATPQLDGTILPGVTRDSILSLCRQWGEFKVSERPITMRELETSVSEGRLLEAFGSGTACIVQPLQGFVKHAASAGTGAKGDGTPRGARDKGDDVEELPVPFDADAAAWWMAQVGSGGLPSGIRHHGGSAGAPRHVPESLCGRLTRAMLDIQYGHTPSPWSVRID